jgi:hypothetical protein
MRTGITHPESLEKAGSGILRQLSKDFIQKFSGNQWTLFWRFNMIGGVMFRARPRININQVDLTADPGRHRRPE